tara:strand:- start:1071 stop:1340 length:270 start_codon:yes stop_codon:yes gene_type:complete
LSKKGQVEYLSRPNTISGAVFTIRDFSIKAFIRWKLCHGHYSAVFVIHPYQIMAVMAHTQARTSEVYTKGVQRRGLATDGMQSLAALGR